RDDPQVAPARADGPLTGDQDFHALVGLLGHVVVVAGDPLHEIGAGDLFGQCPAGQCHHDLAVAACVFLGPEEVAPVGVHLGGSCNEDRQVPVGQVLVVRQLLGTGDVVVGQLLADVSGAGVQYQPHDAVTVQTHFEEVVASTQRAHLSDRTFPAMLDRFGQVVEAFPEGVPPGAAQHGQPLEVDGGVMQGEADRDGGLQRRTQPTQVVGQAVGGQVGAYRGHSATDVDTDRGGADGITHGDDRAHGGALAVVHVRHDGQAVHPGHSGDVVQLLHGLV